MNRLFIYITGALIGFFNSGIMGQSLYEKLAGKIDATVDINGTGNYTTITAAINAAPNSSTSPYVIFIKNGKYVEKVEIPSTKRNLFIIGESVDSAIISWDDYSGSGELYNGIMTSRIGDSIGTSTSHTLYIDADDVTIMNLTVENSAGDVGQAVAVNCGADRTSIVRCRLMGNQDTFYTWGYGRFYLKDTYIEGDVDFIFGRGTALFDSCQINSNTHPNGGGYLTAASTDTLWKFGYVFKYCKVTANPGVTGVTLGRPWRPNAQTVFMNTYMGPHIASAGWTAWDGREEICFYAEYNNLGPGFRPASRVAWSYQLDSAQASEYTLENVFAKDVNPSPFSSNWAPAFLNDTIYTILQDHTDLLYNDTTFNMPYLVSILVNDSAIDNFSSTTPNYSFELPSGTAEIPDIDPTPLDSLAQVVVTNPSSLPGVAGIKVTARNNAVLIYSVSLTIATDAIEVMNTFQYRMLNNPCKDYFQIEYTNSKLSNPTIEIYNLAGKLMSTKTFNSIAVGSNTLSISTDGLADGMYIFFIRTDGYNASGKFVKQGL